jgi:hypothetical protein
MICSLFSGFGSVISWFRIRVIRCCATKIFFVIHSESSDVNEANHPTYLRRKSLVQVFIHLNITSFDCQQMCFILDCEFDQVWPPLFARRYATQIGLIEKYRNDASSLANCSNVRNSATRGRNTMRIYCLWCGLNTKSTPNWTPSFFNDSRDVIESCDLM